jgi:hypothetical protein
MDNRAKRLLTFANLQVAAEALTLTAGLVVDGFMELP